MMFVVGSTALADYRSGSAMGEVVVYGAAGLSLLVGISIVFGGLGILGGVSVISTISNLAITVAVDVAYSQVHSGTHRNTITLIKPGLFWNYVSPVVKSEMK